MKTGTYKKITSFTDLKVWQEGHQLVLSVYKLLKNFPSEERYALSDQMRRSAISVTSNIAEGFGRRGVRERMQFYFLSRGSLTELKNQLLIVRDVQYVTTENFAELADQANTVHKLLQGLISSTKKLSEDVTRNS